MATAILFNSAAGYAGAITRPDVTNVEPVLLVAQSGVYAQTVGIPVKYVAGGVAQFTGGEAASVFAGVLSRQLPAGGISGTAQGFNDFIPNYTQVQGLVVRGYMNVFCTQGTPARGGAVYVRVVAATGKNIGDLEATLDSTAGNNVLLPNVTWAVDGKDAGNIAEIRIAQ